MNYIKNIAEMLGLEWYEDIYESEEFKIVGSNAEFDIFKLTKIGLVDKDGDTREVMFEGLMTGKYIIKKLPFKPKLKEKYYIPSLYDYCKYKELRFLNDYTDERLMKINLICRTKEEAIKLTDQALKLWGIIE